MNRKEQLNELMMAMPSGMRTKWCECANCECEGDGAASCRGGLLKAGFSFEEWNEWVFEHTPTMLVASPHYGYLKK